MKPVLALFSTTVFLCCKSSAGHAADPEDYLVVPYVINHVQAGRGWRNAFRECLNNDQCSDAVDAAGSYFGVPPGTIQQTVETVDAVGLGPVKNTGEEFWQNIEAPPGYFLCDAHLKIISAAPHTGRPPNFDMTVGFPGMCSYSYVRVQRDPNQRSWVEAIYTAKYMLYSKRNDPDAAACTYFNATRVRYSCWGSDCQADGPLDGKAVGDFAPFCANWP